MSPNKSKTLSLEESQEINRMMQDQEMKNNATEYVQKPKKPKSQKRLKADQEVDAAYKAMKKVLKLRSKSELIEVLWANGLQMRQFQGALKQLLDENKALQKENDTLKSDPSENIKESKNA